MQADNPKPYITIGIIGYIDDKIYRRGQSTLTAAIMEVLYTTKGLGVKSRADIGTCSTDIYMDKNKLETEKRCYIAMEWYNREFHIMSMLYGERFSNTWEDYPGLKPWASPFEWSVFTGEIIQAAILVVSALEGITDKAKEQISFVRKMASVSRMVVFLDQCGNMEDEELLGATEMEIRDVLGKNGFDADHTPIIRGSARETFREVDALHYEHDPSSEWNRSILDLMEALDQWIEVPAPKHKPFLMGIKEVWDDQESSGVWVSGDVMRGTVKVSDEVELFSRPEDRKSIVKRKFAVAKTEADELHFPDYPVCDDDLYHPRIEEKISVFLDGVRKADIETGLALAEVGSMNVHKKFVALIYVIMKKNGGTQSSFSNDYRPEFFIYHYHIHGRITLPEGVEKCKPGEYMEMTVELEEPTPMEQGIHFSIWDTRKNFGLGKVLRILE